MRLLFKQRMFSWFDSYDIYDENENTVYVCKGQLSWGHCIKIFDAAGNEVGMIQERVFTLLPKFEIYMYGEYVGEISKQFTFFIPKYNIDFKGWEVEGSMWEWDYQITDSHGNEVASVSKELFHWTDTYIIDVHDPENALAALAFALAMDAEKCSRNN